MSHRDIWVVGALSFLLLLAVTAIPLLPRSRPARLESDERIDEEVDDLRLASVEETPRVPGFRRLPSPAEVEPLLKSRGFAAVRSYRPFDSAERGWSFERVTSEAVIHVRLYGPSDQEARVFRVIARNFSEEPRRCQSDLADLAAVALGEANRAEIRTWIDSHFGKDAALRMAGLTISLAQPTAQETRLTVE